MNRLIFFILCCISTLTFAEEIYKTTDENGNTVYTDTPQDKAEKVEIKELNTLPPPEYRARGLSDSGYANKGPVEYTLQISSPIEGSQVTPQQTTLNIQVDLNTPLEEEHFIQYYLNGVIEGEPQKATSLEITNLRRGQKQISAAVVDKNGNVLASSQLVTVFVIRPNAKPK